MDKAAGIRRYHKAVRKIAKKEGVSFAQARAIYLQKQASSPPVEGMLPRIAGEIRERMLALENNPDVNEYKTLVMAYAAITKGHREPLN